MKIGVVMNPRAGGGRLGAEWPALAQALEQRLGAIEVVATKRVSEASSLAHQLAATGAELILAAGGDGTMGEVADGIMRAGGRAAFAVIPFGTGLDFPRNLGLGPTPLDAVEAIASGRTRRIDVGRIGYVADDGTPGVRHFINETSFGLSGPTVRAVNAAKQRGRVGKGVFLWHTLSQLFRYAPVRVRVTLDDAEVIEEEIAVVAVCNGKFFGGGMMVAPDAAIEDCLFDVVIVRQSSKLELISTLNRAYSGGHLKSRICTFRRARKVRVDPVGKAALIDIDGESPGCVPATVEMLPGALTLRA